MRPTPRLVVSLSTGIVAVFLGSFAPATSLAQDDAAAAPAAEPTTAAAEPAPAAAASQPAPAATATPAPRRAHEPEIEFANRLRLGLELAGGTAYNSSNGATLALIGQIGWQMAENFALYYQPSALALEIFSFDEAPAHYVMGNVAMMQATFVDWVELGIGGGFDYGKFYYCHDGTCVSNQGVHPVMALRAAFVVRFGNEGDKPRWGIPLGLQARASFWNGERQGILLLSVGVQRY